MNRKKWLSVMLGIGIVAASSTAFAETAVDLRMKLGSAAGVDTVEFSGVEQSGVSQESSGNFQIEAAIIPQQSSPISFVGTVGIFGRNHKGEMLTVDFVPMPTEVKYSAGGLSGSAGVGIKANETFHFEGRFELALGVGKPTFTTPGVIWNPVKEGGYASSSLIVGGYATIGKPGLQIGLELGVQSFTGDFQIWNDAGFWEDGKVKGSGGTVNLVVGYRF